MTGNLRVTFLIIYNLVNSNLKSHLKYLFIIISEYSAQLPSEGGAFYHVDTIESARPHYRKSWPSILHALAIWLKEAGFAKLNKEAGKGKGDASAAPDNIPVNMLSEEANAERLYLITGKNGIIYFTI